MLFANGECAAAHLVSPVAAFPLWVIGAALAVFIVALALAVSEEALHLRKSKPVLLGGGIIWALIAWSNHRYQLGLDAEQAACRSLVQYLELMLFLLVVMAYVNAMTERGVFAFLRAWLGGRRVGWRSLFWITDALTFVLYRDPAPPPACCIAAS